jgi:hypothetical protein
MRKLYTLLLAVITLICVFNVPFAGAVSDNVVISQVQLGNSAASNEFVELYNNSSSEVEITDWCLYYASATSTKNGSKMSCFTVENNNLHLFLPGNSSAFLISNELSVAQPDLGSDLKFSATLSGAAGHVRLINGDGIEKDKLGWGSAAVSSEGDSPAAVPSSGSILSRKIFSTGKLQDTDLNSEDFELVLPQSDHTWGSIYEVQDICSNLDGIQYDLPEGYMLELGGTCSLPPVDICQNLDGLQTILPVGYLLDENGDCRVDVCLNLSGLQLVLPDGMELDDMGNCVPHDMCLNLTGPQSVIPDGYSKSGSDCVLNLLPLKLSELLPNAIGTDDGNEYIEIYNPNTSAVNLMNYVLYIGSNLEHFYSFPTGLAIGPGEYTAFYSDDIKFTLVNTTSRVTLRSLDNMFVDEAPYYSDPKDGMAWALIDDVWQYTNKPTPGGQNKSSYVEEVVVVASTLQPCAPNQYRNPETNRCKLIPTVSSNLVPCKVGQYRSEETNRCRNIASDVSNLVPCAEGQERNPATNRCRSVSAVLAASNLVPCKEGQERNPETNRCRNIASSDIPVAEFAVEQTSARPDNSIVWWSLAGVAVLAITYGVWEWRQEIGQLVKKVVSVLNRQK